MNSLSSPLVSPLNTVGAVSFLLENNLNFRVSVSLEDAKEILRSFKRYNEIPSNLPEIVEAIKLAIGPINFGPQNLNNGGFHHIRFSIGNENSLVIYVEVSSFYFGQHPEKIQKVVRSLQAVGQKFRADENDVEGNEASISARFWWD